MLKSVRAAAVTLSYDEEGSGEPLVFVHGIPTDYRVWDSQLNDFSKEFRTISYSRRHAYPNQNAGDPSESTVQKNSEDLMNFAQQLNLGKLNLVGHSYGGFVSLYTAWKHPGLIRTLVLVEPAVPSILVRNEKDSFEALGFLLRNPGAAISARRFQNGKLRAALKAYESGDFNTASKSFYDGIKERDGAFEEAPEKLRQIMLQNGQTIGELETTFPILAKEDAREIMIPTLLVKGEESPKWLRRIVDGLGQSLPKSSVVEIARSGHLPHIDNASDFNTAIRRFLEKNAPK
jgi:non-heme chloroperoxidase